MAGQPSSGSVIRILGVDPGSRLLGYGCVDLVGSSIKHVTHGTLHLCSTGGKSTVPLEERLLGIFEGLTQVIQEFKPKVVSVEKVFFAKNAVSALKLGQARGAAILTARIQGLEIVEYSATEIKSSVCGHGQADKDQVAKMLGLLLGKQDFVTSDASDGLAAALCHAQALCNQLAQSGGIRDLGRSPTNGTRRSKKLSLAEALAHKIPKI